MLPNFCWRLGAALLLREALVIISSSLSLSHWHGPLTGLIGRWQSALWNPELLAGTSLHSREAHLPLFLPVWPRCVPAPGEDGSWAWCWAEPSRGNSPGCCCLRGRAGGRASGGWVALPRVLFQTSRVLTAQTTACGPVGEADKDLCVVVLPSSLSWPRPRAVGPQVPGRSLSAEACRWKEGAFFFCWLYFYGKCLPGSSCCSELKARLVSLSLPAGFSDLLLAFLSWMLGLLV